MTRQHFAIACLRAVRVALLGAYLAIVLWLCVLAVRPADRQRLPGWLSWLGAPGSWQTLLVAVMLPVGAVLLGRVGRKARPGWATPLILTAMATSVVVLGLAGFWRCYDDQSAFFAPLSWTLNLFAGDIEGRYGSGSGACGSDHLPVALELARLLAITTTLGAAVTAVLALFRLQIDRIAIRRSRWLTVVLGIDDNSISIIRAIIKGVSRQEAVLILTDTPEHRAPLHARKLGARLREASVDEPAVLAELSFWKRLSRLYLLSADPSQNERRLQQINTAMDALGDNRTRLPLTVRVDDPWQAEVWRRRFFEEQPVRNETGSDSKRWVADAIGQYENTAAKLVRRIIRRDQSNQVALTTRTVLLCGLTPLTYALCSEFAQVNRERRVHAKPHEVMPDRIVVLAVGASSFIRDHQIRQTRLAPGDTALAIEPLDTEATVDAITEYLNEVNLREVTAILVDPQIESDGTRLASRFPMLHLYQASALTESFPKSAVIGRMFPFPINMELDEGAPQDVWERAAELIHESYSSSQRREEWAARQPWRKLDSFIKRSNRRQIVNVMQLVEFAGHTWNTLEAAPSTPLPENFSRLSPLEQLDALGFSREAVEKIVRCEHEDWRRFYIDEGWRYARTRSDGRRRHDRLLSWDTLVEQDETLRLEGAEETDDRLFVPQAFRSLASTLVSLRALGYRSVRKQTSTASGSSEWKRYRRRGEVSAQKRDFDWTWTNAQGHTMQAKAGDWAVTDSEGRERSVAAGIFEATHHEIRAGYFRREGTLLARRVIIKETVATEEGEAIAQPGDWVIEGDRGELWPVPARQFFETYEGPVDDDALSNDAPNALG